MTHDMGEEVTLAAIKKKMSESEREKAANGSGEVTSLGTTPSDFIVEGMDLEEQQ